MAIRKVMIMTAITREDAERLYEILDANVGVFRTSDMTEKAEKFYRSQREKFLEAYTGHVPDDYWFQGFGATSVTLCFDSVEGFHLVSETCGDNRELHIIEETNRLLKKADIKLLVG